MSKSTNKKIKDTRLLNNEYSKKWRQRIRVKTPTLTTTTNSYALALTLSFFPTSLSSFLTSRSVIDPTLEKVDTAAIYYKNSESNMKVGSKYFDRVNKILNTFQSNVLEEILGFHSEEVSHNITLPVSPYPYHKLFF